MSRNQQFAALNAFLATVLMASSFTANAWADPLPGRDLLKFSQKPMINTTVVDDNGLVNTYQGHDELSTAYNFGSIPLWEGRFMADDFADKLTSPVVHVKWWGSYLGEAGPQNPNMPVNKFLISFESDAPVSATNPFSHPDQPLLNQMVFRNPQPPTLPGTFTEKLIRGPDPILGESLYEYNAELQFGQEFMEVKDTVYWLKIVAMVDTAPAFLFDPYNPQNAPFPVTQWGWHNRDYTIQDTLASPNVTSFPFGEFIEGTVGGANQPVWHFQDDAVAGDVQIIGTSMPGVVQTNMSSQFYLDGIDGPPGGIPGTHGIGRFSKDLAFELYTVVPEPASCLLLLVGVTIAISLRRRSVATQ